MTSVPWPCKWASSYSCVAGQAATVLSLSILVKYRVFLSSPPSRPHLISKTHSLSLGHTPSPSKERKKEKNTFK